jgi:Flp pilus assembly pilin Flp
VSRVSRVKDNLPLVFLESREQTGLTHQKGEEMNIQTFRNLWSSEEGQDIAEYAVMLAVILVLVVGTIRLIGGSSNNVFSSVASSIGQ